MQKPDKPICYIVGAGELYAPLAIAPQNADYVIAADGGFRYLQEAGIHVNLLIGDFDSQRTTNMDNVSSSTVTPHSSPLIPTSPTNRHQPSTVIIKLPSQKNETDMYAAIAAGLERGYQTFRIYGGLGGSARHTLANIQCLKMLAARGCRGYLIGEREVLTAIHAESIEFPANRSGVISVFSLGEKACGVSLKNLRYPLEDYTISDAYPIGVSNEFIGKAASVSVKEGTLLLVYDLL